MATIESWASPWFESGSAEGPVILQGRMDADWERVEREVALLMVCDSDGCGRCAECKKVAAEVHPDVLRFTDETKTLKVGEVRVMREQWSKIPFGSHRLIILPRAERLTAEAANALLKELEEPTAHNRFLLWTSWPGRLLMTIRSRSQLIRLDGSYMREIVRESAEMGNLLSWKRKQPFSEEELLTLYLFLQKRAKEAGVDGAWIQASRRLRDFYQVASRQGNVKLASDVLLASLHELRY